MVLNTVNMVNPVIEVIETKNGNIISATGNRYIYDVTNNKVNPKILFVTDSRLIGLDSMDTQTGLTASGFTGESSLNVCSAFDRSTKTCGVLSPEISPTAEWIV